MSESLKHSPDGTFIGDDGLIAVIKNGEVKVLLEPTPTADTEGGITQDPR